MEKYYGDVCCRIFREFILKEIPPNYTISSPNVYIVGFPTEFDLLIIDKDANPERYTNAFSPAKVKCGIEVKAHGFFGGREELEKEITKTKQNFEDVNKHFSHIKFFYLTYEEVAYPKKEKSIRYLDETHSTLAPYEVFCLRDSRTRKLIDGEWKRLTCYLKFIL